MNHFLCLRFMILTLLISFVKNGFTQDYPDNISETGQLESLAEKKDADPEDDSYEMDLEYRTHHPLNLNQASSDELAALHLLTALQISNFLLYRKLLGSLLSIYELQAVPGWDLTSIKELLPYIKVGKNESLYSAIRDRWRGGDASLLIRESQVLEKAAGYQKPANPEASHYLGSPQKIFFRYTYNYKQLLQYGFSGDKDAGEPFLRGAQRYGFDFYSFHFFLRNAGLVRNLALGDFTVNLGQGLIQWQTISFTKGGNVLGIKRQAAPLRPYRSAGEFNFHRGAGISLQKGNWSSTLFLSNQKISSNAASDTAGREDLFTSFENSGYHRTANEIADRNNNRQFSAGGNLVYDKQRFNMSVNFIHFGFGKSVQKEDAPYNLYSFKGRSLTNISFSYGYTFRNMHWFGELAFDQARHPAWVQGVLMSLGAALDLSLLYRNISPAYQSAYADAYTENSSPVNEKGFYTGLSFRPLNGFSIEMYYDLFVFPWLKYRVDAPGYGNDFLIRTFFQPDKKWYISSDYKQEKKPGNQEIAEMTTHPVFSPVKKRWELETGYKINPEFRFKAKMAYIWIQKDWEQIKTKQEGFLGFLDIFYHSLRINANLRIQHFLTPGYDFRIYIYENDMLFSFSLPPSYNNGWRFYININKGFHLSEKLPGSHPVTLTAWVKWGLTLYTDKPLIGSGLDQISSNKKTDLKFQIRINW